MRRIPVAEPFLRGNEQKYVQECFETGWISGSGAFVNAFEEKFAAFCNARYAVAVFNGTVALHLALLALGIQEGDEIIVPDLTYIASANAVTYCRAKPIFVDVDLRTWTLDPGDAERKITARTRAIMPVHLYGHPADMQPIMDLAKRHQLAVVEDAAEAHGAEYKGERVGGIGDISTFSFYGNKIITTGEGGMVVTNDEHLALHIKQLKGQGQDFERRYWFPIVGYNYRMTNVQAAIGLAQMEQIDWFIERRIEVAHWYNLHLKDSGSCFQRKQSGRRMFIGFIPRVYLKALTGINSCSSLISWGIGTWAFSIDARYAALPRFRRRSKIPRHCDVVSTWD